MYGNQAILRMLDRSRSLVQRKCACDKSQEASTIGSLPLQPRSQELSRLHSVYGNQAILRMPGRSRSRIQRKCACGGSAASGELSASYQENEAAQTNLAVSHPGDEFEVEADRTADQVIHTPDSEGQLMGGERIHRKWAECKDRAQAALTSRDSVDDLDMEDQEDLISVDGPDETAVNAGGPDAGTGDAGVAGGGTVGPSTPPATCPTATAVDTITNLTPAGLSAGYLTAYGIMARMKVLPDSTNWDGVSVVEANTVASSTCPATLTHPGPCTGNATFVVGSASGKSNVQPVQPAMQNRFYDFHTTHTRALSVLHDSTRNPAGLNSCKTVCKQTYSCGGAVIGTHTVTRTFTKGTSGGNDVTIVNVTKT
jgi:hypothetical protein